MSRELETANGEGKNRKRLRPLLQKVLNDNSVPGLHWRDRGKQIWQMPWKFHKQTKWDDPDAMMLRELAKSLYNYDGPDEPPKEKLKYWKQLLRNALRSLKDINELKDLHITEGKSSCKVYQFVDSESEVVRRGRGRGSTGCQSGDTERLQRIPTVAMNCSNSQESYSSSTDHSNLQQHAANQTAPPVTLPIQLQFHDVIFHDKSSEMVNCDSITQAVVSQRGPQFSPLAKQSLFVNDEADIFSGNFSEGVDDITLNKLVSEFNLDNFRSRSPLRQDNEEMNDMDINEMSPTDVEMLNNRTQPELANSTIENSSYDRNQQCPIAMEFAEATPQNMEGNYSRTNAANTGCLTASMDSFYRLRNEKSSAICKASPLYIAEQTQANCRGDTVLSGINSHRLASKFLAEKSLPSYQISQQGYPSISSIMGTAPASSVFVVVNYNLCQVITGQIFSEKFRICFVPDEETKESIQTCPDPKLLGPTDAKLFELPDIKKDSLEARDTKNILRNLTRGIIVDLRERKIYATRYCKAVPHFCIPGKTEFTKMERHQEVKLFDFNDYFELPFDPQYRYHNANPHVRLSFAVKDANKRVSPISVDIWHAEAYQARPQSAENTHSLEADCSLSDEFDRRMQIEQQLKKSMLHI